MKIGYARVSTEDQNPDLQLVGFSFYVIFIKGDITNPVIGFHGPHTDLCLRSSQDQAVIIVD
jgi:hypothetical protein